MTLEKFYEPDSVPVAVNEMLSEQAECGALADDFEAWNPEDWEDEDPSAMWLGKQPSQRLITVGKGGDGSLYVLWCHDGHGPEKAPVCYLGSEGEGNTVLATNLQAFWEMLGTGETWGPYDKRFYPPQDAELDEEDPEGPAYFRKRFRAAHRQPRPADAIREEALRRHPDFEAFIVREMG